MLNQIQLENIKLANNIIIATADFNNKPRAIIVQPSRVEKDKIIICNIQMNKTFENLKANKNCFVNIYLPDQEDLQYKIEGTTT